MSSAIIAADRDGSDRGSASGSTHAQPQRGAEALSNFYNRRLSTDIVQDQLMSYGKLTNRRRSSHVTTDTNLSNGQSQDLDGGHGHGTSTSSSASSNARGPRVYSSFSAAAAAASLSSLNNRRVSQNMSDRQSPHPSSPQPSAGVGTPASHRRSVSGSNRASLTAAPTSMDEIGSAYHSTGSHGMTRSSTGQPSPSISPNQSDADKRRSMQGLDSPLRPTPEQIRFASSWLASGPTSRRESNLEKSGSALPQINSALALDASPDLAQYSTGLGFGWNPQALQPPKPVKSRLRANSKPKSRSNSVVKPPTPTSASYDTEKASRAQPGFSASGPIPVNIAEELDAASPVSTSKPDSALARFGRVFRRRKSGGEDRESKRSGESSRQPPLPGRAEASRRLSQGQLSNDSAPLTIISAKNRGIQQPSSNSTRSGSVSSPKGPRSPGLHSDNNALLPRPLSSESATSTTNRSSMAFLASAITVGGANDDVANSALFSGNDNTTSSDLKKPKSGVGPSMPVRSDSTTASLNTADVHAPERVESSSRTPSGSRLQPKSATRDDNFTSILTDFLKNGPDEPKTSKPAFRQTSTSETVTNAGSSSRVNSKESHTNLAEISATASLPDQPRRKSAGTESFISDALPSTKSEREVAALTMGSGQGSAPFTTDLVTSAETAQDTKVSGKPRKMKSHSSLRIFGKDAAKEAVPRASMSDMPKNHTLAASGTKADGPAGRSDGAARSTSFGSKLLRRPKTSNTVTGTSSFSDDLTASDQVRRGSAASRASLDAGPRNNSESLVAAGGFLSPQDSRLISQRNDSLLSPGGQNSTSETSQASSKLENRGGAAGLFGTSPARSRTASSLLPTFGFGRSRAGSYTETPTNGSELISDSASPRLSAERGSTPKSEAASSFITPAPARVSGGSIDSRPSFNRSHSNATLLTVNGAQTKAEPKFSASAFLPYDDESAEEYAERMVETAPKVHLTALLASSADIFYVDALQHCMNRFSFSSIPLDIALRKLLMDLHLPKETQQIDRVMEAFAKRYNECNATLFTSVDQPYILAFSLMLLHSDAFNKNAKVKMTKADYLRNTAASGVSQEILEYLYDNLTFTQFIYVEDAGSVGRSTAELSMASTTNVSALPNGTNTGSRLKLDPYFLIAQNRLGELRPNFELLIPEDTPFSYTGSIPAFDIDRLNTAFLHAPSIEIVTTKAAAELGGSTSSLVAPVEEDVVSLKVTKVGVVNRKDDMSDGGKKAGSRKWKTSGMLLTGSQLLIFKDVVWIGALQSQILEQVGHSLLNNGLPTDDTSHLHEERDVVITPRITYFRPDGVISLADAVAVKEKMYGKYDFVFRLLAAKGRQYLVQAQSEDDMNDWIHKINFCATFRTANIKIRGPDMATRPDSRATERSSQSTSLDRPALRSGHSQTSLSDAERSNASNSRAALRSRDAPRDSLGDASFDSQSNDSHSRTGSDVSVKIHPRPSALMKRALARKETMMAKIGEFEAELDRVAKQLQEEIRLVRHLAILTPFLRSTRERIEMSALPLSERIRTLRLDVAKTDSRCKILRMDLAAGEKAVQSQLPSLHLAGSAVRLTHKASGTQLVTPPLLEKGGVTESQAGFEDLFGGSMQTTVTSAPFTKPATQQRQQMNLIAVSEQPALESPALTTRPLPSGEASPFSNAADLSSDFERSVNIGQTTPARSDEVPEEWNQSQIADKGSNRISLVNLPTPSDLQEAKGMKSHTDAA